jgi:hypothetical protein
LSVVNPSDLRAAKASIAAFAAFAAFNSSLMLTIFAS